MKRPIAYGRCVHAQTAARLFEGGWCRDSRCREAQSPTSPSLTSLLLVAKILIQIPRQYPGSFASRKLPSHAASCRASNDAGSVVARFLLWFGAQEADADLSTIDRVELASAVSEAGRRKQQEEFLQCQTFNRTFDH